MQISLFANWGLNKLLKQCLGLASLMLAMVWAPQAMATVGCEIQAGAPASVAVNAGGNATFTANFVDITGGCGALANLNFSVLSDTTGGVTLPANQTGLATPGSTTLSVTAGTIPGGTAVIRATCVGGACFNGAIFADFTINTNNAYAFTATSPTAITTNQLVPITLSTNLLVNGTGPGVGYATRFADPTPFATVLNDAAGNASVTTPFILAGVVNVTASVICPPPTPLGCPPATIPFTVTVEAVTLTAVTPASGAVGISAGGSTTLVTRYGGPTVPTLPGDVISWAVTASPAGGNGVISGVTTTNGVGNSQAAFTATVPGVYTVTASSGDTFSPDSTEDFTITVTAITRTLAVSSGNGQTAPTNTALPLPLVALAQDNGVFAPGITINWAVVSGSATLSAATSVTNAAAGLASINVTLGPTPGPIVITGTRADDTTAVATFNINSTLVRTLTITSGNGQSVSPGSPLPLPLVVNAQNNGVAAAGVAINWTITAGSTVGAAVTATSGTGVATNSATLGAAVTGAVTVTATRQDDATATVSFTINGVKLSNIAGLSSHQLSLANALDTICSRLNAIASPTAQQTDFIARCNELVSNATANPADVIRALDELLPNTQAAQARSSLLTASRQFETLNARIAALRSGTQGGSFDGLALNGPNGSVSMGALMSAFTGDNANNSEVGADFQRWGFFASGSIGSGDADAAGLTPSYDFDINGLTVGVDYRQSDKFIFGAAIGYNNQDTKLAPGQGGVDASGYTLSAYGTYFKSSSWYTDTVLTFGKNNYDLVRQINYTVPDGLGGFTTVNQTARSDSGGDLLSFGATLGRDFQKGGWSIGPYGRVLYTRLNFDRIQETLVSSGPGAGLALIVEERSLDSLASVIGSKFTKAISTSWGVLTPHFQIEWEHEFNSDPGAAVARFVNDPSGTAIVLSDSPYDSNFFRIGLGLSAIMSKGRSAFFYYDKAIGRDGISQDNLALGLRMEF